MPCNSSVKDLDSCQILFGKTLDPIQWSSLEPYYSVEGHVPNTMQDTAAIEYQKYSDELDVLAYARFKFPLRDAEEGGAGAV